MEPRRARARGLSRRRLTPPQTCDGRRRKQEHDDVAGQAPLAEGADGDDLDDDEIAAEEEPAEGEGGAGDPGRLAGGEGGSEDGEVAESPSTGTGSPRTSAYSELCTVSQPPVAQAMVASAYFA